MLTYVILRSSGWNSAEALQAVAERSARVRDEEIIAVADRVVVRLDRELGSA